uniref:Uncharacterized protein n=1 Tax=Ciona intestinalis TaxID=7719 RepID=H2XXZ0_CIOIN
MLSTYKPSCIHKESNEPSVCIYTNYLFLRCLFLRDVHSKKLYYIQSLKQRTLVSQQFETHDCGNA